MSATTTERLPEAKLTIIQDAVPNAAALVDAVSAEDREAVAEVLTALDRQGLYALAVVLASQLLPS